MPYTPRTRNNPDPLPQTLERLKNAELINEYKSDIETLHSDIETLHFVLDLGNRRNKLGALEAAKQDLENAIFRLESKLTGDENSQQTQYKQAKEKAEGKFHKATNAVRVMLGRKNKLTYNDIVDLRDLAREPAFKDCVDQPVDPQLANKENHTFEDNLNAYEDILSKSTPTPEQQQQQIIQLGTIIYNAVGKDAETAYVKRTVKKDDYLKEALSVLRNKQTALVNEEKQRLAEAEQRLAEEANKSSLSQCLAALKSNAGDLDKNSDVRQQAMALYHSMKVCEFSDKKKAKVCVLAASRIVTQTYFLTNNHSNSQFTDNARQNIATNSRMLNMRINTLTVAKGPKKARSLLRKIAIGLAVAALTLSLAALAVASFGCAPLAGMGIISALKLHFLGGGHAIALGVTSLHAHATTVAVGTGAVMLYDRHCNRRDEAERDVYKVKKGGKKEILDAAGELTNAARSVAYP